MHGFVVKSKMYDKLKLESSSFSYNQYKKDKLKTQLDEQMKNRIYVKNNQSRVNEGVITKIREDGSKQERLSKKQVKDMQAKDALIEDSRFKSMFEDKNFQVDETSDAFRARHPATRLKAAAKDMDDQYDGNDYEEGGYNEQDNVEYQDTAERYDKKALTNVVRKGQVFSGLSYEDKQHLVGKYSKKIGKDDKYSNNQRGGSGYSRGGSSSFRGGRGGASSFRGGRGGSTRGANENFGVRSNKSQRGGKMSFPAPQRKFI